MTELNPVGPNWIESVLLRGLGEYSPAGLAKSIMGVESPTFS